MWSTFEAHKVNPSVGREDKKNTNHRKYQEKLELDHFIYLDIYYCWVEAKRRPSDYIKSMHGQLSDMQK